MRLLTKKSQMKLSLYNLIYTNKHSNYIIAIKVYSPVGNNEVEVEKLEIIELVSVVVLVVTNGAKITIECNQSRQEFTRHKFSEIW